MKFITDRHHVNHPVSRIKDFFIPLTEKHVLITLEDDTKIEVEHGAFRQFLSQQFTHVVPALPETYALIPICGDDDYKGPTHSKDPVIAWGIDRSGRPSAITLEGVEEEDRAVLMPDGRVYVPYMSDYASVEEYAADPKAHG